MINQYDFCLVTGLEMDPDTNGKNKILMFILIKIMRLEVN